MVSRNFKKEKTEKKKKKTLWGLLDTYSLFVSCFREDIINQRIREIPSFDSFFLCFAHYGGKYNKNVKVKTWDFVHELYNFRLM